MELIFRGKFSREYFKIKNKECLKFSSDIFKQIEKANSITEIGGLKKLREYGHYYRIKIKISEKNDYRMVLMIRGNKVWAERIGLAKNIFYKQ